MCKKQRMRAPQERRASPQAAREDEADLRHADAIVCNTNSTNSNNSDNDNDDSSNISIDNNIDSDSNNDHNTNDQYTNSKHK